MSASPAARQTSGRGGDLNRDAIIAATRDLLRVHGVDGLSMRQLAGDMGVTATALYYHIGSKQALLDAVITILLREIEPGDPSMPWQDALEDLMVRLQYLASDYPGIQRYLADNLTCQGTLTWMDLMLKPLQAAGFDPRQQVMAMNILGFYNSALPLRARGRVEGGPWEQVQSGAVAASFEVDPQGFPHLGGVIGLLRPPDEAAFRTGLRCLIAGLKDMASADGAAALA